MIQRRDKNTGKILKKTNTEFIRELKKKFSNSFNYSKVNYKGSRTKIILICEKHGEFQSKPVLLLGKKNPRLCEYCEIDIKKNEFIKRANKIHKNKYDYSNVVFKNQKTKVEIICPENLHGQWSVTPDNHVSKKSGCPACGFIKQVKSQTKSTAKFKSEIKRLFGRRYLLNKVEYINAHTPVIVTCKKHGDFPISPTSLLQGTNCFKCSLIESGLKRRKNNNAFIEQAEKIHGLKYDYSKTNYKKAKIPVQIICKKHGEFSQLPDTHLSGAGCNKCGNEQIGKKLRNDIDKVINAIEKSRGKNLFDFSLLKNSYVNNRTKTAFTCLKHNKVFFSTTDDLVRYGGCEDCKIKSVGQEKIKTILIEKNIQFISEWKNHNCKLIKGKASFDFYLPKSKMLIEFDGEQHFKPVQFGAMSFEEAKDEYLKTKERDKIKNKWAKNNKLRLLRIKYNENIEKKLQTFI